jgi:hypothetical protein
VAEEHSLWALIYEKGGHDRGSMALEMVAGGRTFTHILNTQWNDSNEVAFCNLTRRGGRRGHPLGLQATWNEVI